jgi:dGTPase
MAYNVVEGLFQALLPWTQDPERLSASNNRVLTSFGRFIAERYSEQEALGARQVVDYIAGMTDSFATKCFEELYWF